jgi:hypothetical protein
MLAVLASALVLAGCGSGTLPPASGLDPADQLIRTARIAATPPGPVRTLLQFWHAVQYNDLSSYLATLPPAIRAQRTSSPLTAVELPVASRALDVALPRIESVAVNGTQATINTLLAYHQLVGASAYTTIEVPQAFTLVNEAGRWYMADDQFVVEQSRPALIQAGVLPAAVAAGASTAANVSSGTKPALAPVSDGASSVSSGAGR